MAKPRILSRGAAKTIDKSYYTKRGRPKKVNKLYLEGSAKIQWDTSHYMEKNVYISRYSICAWSIFCKIRELLRKQHNCKIISNIFFLGYLCFVKILCAFIKTKENRFWHLRMANGLYMREAYIHVHCLLAKGWIAQVHDYWLHGR
jgi:hypothetical protein